MDTTGQKKLQRMKTELNSIMRILEAAATDVRQNFAGIGNDRAADTLEGVWEQCELVRKKLNNIHINKSGQKRHITTS